MGIECCICGMLFIERVLSEVCLVECIECLLSAQSRCDARHYLMAYSCTKGI